jgi:thymidine kinase
LYAHNGRKIDLVYKTKQLKNIYKFKLMDDVNITDIYINECQFFMDLKQFVLNCIKLKINVHIFGLDGDYKQEKFGEIYDVIPFSNSLTKLKGKCNYCDNDSIISHRITNNKEQYLIDNKCYIPLCLSCSKYSDISI